MKFLNYIVATLLVLIVGNMNIYAGTYSGGSGTSGDPYQISTTADLIELSNTNADWVAGIYFIQTANITFNENEQLVDWDGDGDATWDTEDQLGFNPIGKGFHNSFRGTYDGQNYTILNLYINRTATSNIGLFGFIRGSDALVTNSGLLNVNITGLNTVGGLVGISLYGVINNSFATGIINGNSSIGGLIGTNNYGIATNSYSTASVVGSSDYIGGFTGRLAGGEISYCYSTGSVSGANYIGGFVGLVGLEGGISNCYSIGSVSGANYVGGFTGLNSMVISNCYSTGNVSGTSFVGGLLGSNSGTVTNCFWDTETSGQSSSAGGTGKTTAEMKTQSTFTDASWDFSGDAETDWVMSSNISFFAYPTLRWTGGYSVAPTGSPKEIATLPNLVWVAEAMSISPTDASRWTSSYIQTADLIMWTTPSWDGNKGWTPMGNSSVNFTGTYDGQNNTISNLFINRTTDYTGLFGFTNDSGERVKNLGLRQVHITGSNYVSALVGINLAGTISNSYSTGIIKATGFYVGSLVGFNYFGTISNSFSSGQVNGTGECVGGLVGYQYFGSTNNSYSTSDVNGSSNYVGGLIAYKHFGSVNNSYSSGNVTSSGSSVGGLIGFNLGENVNNCFWDTQTSGQASSSGGTGKTTAQMKNIATFTDYTDGSDGLTQPVWDFVNNPNDDASNNNNWRISPNNYNGYPFLGWQPFCEEEVWVNNSYTDETNGWGVTHFNDLTTALSIACSSATVNISNYTHTGDIDMTGRTFIVGDQDFDLTGKLSGGLIQVKAGNIIHRDLAARTTTTIPITDGDHNYTITVTTSDIPASYISVRISNQNPPGSINSDFWDIEGPDNLQATITLRVDKAAIAPKTLSSSSQLRYFDGTKYTPVNGNNFSIEEFDDYYIITITGVNKF